MSKRVLLVEDDESTRKIVTIILEMNGFEVIAYNDCQNIVQRVESDMPDLVLMDIWLPGLGGEYAAKELKNNALTTDIPVLLFSSEDEIMDTCKRIGAEGAIRKPFDITELANTVTQHLH